MSERPKIPMALRKRVLKRDGWHCIIPGCVEHDSNLHHIVMISEDGPTNLENLATLCPTHHKKVHTYKYRTNIIKQLVRYNMMMDQLKREVHRYPRKIESPGDLDFRDAMVLYEKEIPEDERDDPKEIKRWFDECSVLYRNSDILMQHRTAFRDGAENRLPKLITKLNSNSVELWDHFPYLERLSSKPSKYKRYILEEIREIDDCLWVDRHKGELRGAIYFSYYYRHRYAFVTFAVSKIYKRTAPFLKKALIDYLKVQHPECIAVIGEMDDPRLMSDRKKRRKASARLRRFRQRGGLFLRGAAYMQPKLTPDSKGAEKPLVLLYYPVSSKARGRKYMSRKEYGEVLDFIYEALYADAFWGMPSYESYCRYLTALKKRVLLKCEKRIVLSTTIE